MEQANIGITTEFITIDKLLKFSGVVDSGGQAFQLVLDGLIKINNTPIHEKRKKVFPGDVVLIDNQVMLVVVKEDNENN